MGDQTVAMTILAQLGGSRFLAMTGAKNLVSSANSLSFRLPRIAAKKITHVIIELMPTDTYTVTFLNCRMTRTQIKREVVEKVSDVYAEDLQRIFTATTGLRTRL